MSDNSVSFTRNQPKEEPIQNETNLTKTSEGIYDKKMY